MLLRHMDRGHTANSLALVQPVLSLVGGMVSMLFHTITCCVLLGLQGEPLDLFAIDEEPDECRCGHILLSH